MAKNGAGVESFGMVVFASQWRELPEMRPGKTHTFAAFVHEKLDGNMESYIISWLPSDGQIDGFLQVGRNFSLQESLDWSTKGGMAVFAWHAYEIKETLFTSVLRRIRDLESGNYGYYFLGMGGRDINCTHALSDLDILPGLGVFIRSGVDASRECLCRMQSWSWQSANPGKYEDALNLPPNTINWLEHDRLQRFAEAFDTRKYYQNFAQDFSETNPVIVKIK